MDGRDLLESIVGCALLVSVVVAYPVLSIIQGNYNKPRTKIEYIVKKENARVEKSHLEEDMSGEGAMWGQVTPGFPGGAMGGMALGSSIKNEYYIVNFNGDRKIILSLTNNEDVYNQFNEGDLVNLTYREKHKLFYEDTNKQNLLENNLEGNEFLYAELITNK